MKAEIIAIGDEITTGQRLDTNSQWLAERLTELGCDVVYHTTVADELDANVAVFRTAIDRADLVVATGGLGPTADDLTREALAQTLACELVTDEPSLRHIEALFRDRGRAMPERNRLQSLFPQGTRPLFNAEGTAPGIHAQIPRGERTDCHVFALPGVPAEMKPMFFEAVVPTLSGAGTQRVQRHRRIHCFGLGESLVEAKLPDLIRRGREPRVGITASGATITLRITASGVDEAACQAIMQPTVDVIYEALGHAIYGEEAVELQDVVRQQLSERNLTLATAEVASRGLVAQWLSEAHGNDNSFQGSLVFPSPCETNAVELARLTRKQFGSHLGLGVGGKVHGGDTGRATPPAFQVAVVGDGVELHEWFGSAAHAAIQLTRNAKIALNYLRLALRRKQI
jgi:nicotinamide-nucleotide amidase